MCLDILKKKKLLYFSHLKIFQENIQMKIPYHQAFNKSLKYIKLPLNQYLYPMYIPIKRHTLNQDVCIYLYMRKLLYFSLYFQFQAIKTKLSQ